jgi:PAS domain S-box-containing protein
MKANTIHILLVEDNSMDVRLISETLKEAHDEKYKLHIAKSLAEGISLLDSNLDIDIILADLSLPDSNGMDTFHHIRSHSPKKPIVIMTGYDDQEMAILAVKEGAQDYVFKGDMDGHQIARIIRYAIERSRLFIELDEKNQALEAVKDDLEKEVRARTRELQLERDMAQVYLDNAEIMVVALNTTGEIIKLNRKGRQILGYSEGELLGKNWFETCLPTSGLDNVKEVFNQLMAGNLEAVEYYENLVITKSGEHRLIAWHNQQLIDLHNEIYGLFSSGHDITESRQAEENLKAHVAFLDSVMIQSPYAMWISDAAGTVTRTNEALLRFLNLSNEQIIGRYNVLRDENLNEQGVMPRVKAVYEKQVPARFIILWAGARTGEVDFEGAGELWIDVSLFPIADENGNLANVVCQWVDITERKRAELSLQESAAKLSSIFRVAPVGIGVVANRMLTDVNDRFCEITGYSREELIGQSSRIVYPSDEDYEYVGREKYRQIGLSGTGTVESKFRRKDGRLIDVLLSSTPIDQDDFNLGVTFTALDITDRKSAEHNLIQSEERYRTLASNFPNGAVLLYDLDLRYIIADGAGLADVGLSTAQLEGNTIWDVFPPETSAEIEAGYRAALEGDFIISEVAYGEKIFQTHNIPVKDQDGKIIAGMVVTQDVTERLRAEGVVQDRLKLEKLSKIISTTFLNTEGAEIDEAIKRSLAEIAVFAGANRSSLFILSDDLEQITNTHEWCANPEDSQMELLQNVPFSLFGYYREMLLENETIVISTLEDLPLEATGERDWIKQHGFRSLLFIPLLKLGRLHGTLGIYGVMGSEVIWTPEYVNMLEFVGNIILNVLERKLAEQELDQYRQHLEKLVAERTAQLEAFAYSVSHDLKAPLRGIHGYSRLLDKNYADQLDDEGKLFLKNISQAADSMRQLIDDLLEYSRMERRDIASREIDLRGIVTGLLEEFEPQIKARAVEVQVDLPCTSLHADFESLAQIMRNLIDNAIKYSSQQKYPKIEIGGRLLDNNCQVWVRDNGIGFEMRYQERIFEIFQRLHRVDEYPGTGIGLAIVQKAMQRMGGRVWAESEPGQGATFYLEFKRSLT